MVSNTEPRTLSFLRNGSIDHAKQPFKLPTVGCTALKQTKQSTRSCL